MPLQKSNLDNNKIKEILSKMDFNFLNEITISNSHGDYCMEQVIYNEQNDVFVIDFEKAKNLPIIWEVIRLYSYISKKCKNGEMYIDGLVDYVKEFNNYFKLNKYDF